MDMHEMHLTGETPPNMNEPYSKNLVTIICSFIAFLTVRHVCKSMYQKRTFLTPLASRYHRIETIIINLFSFQLFSVVCPPLGAFFIVIIMIASILPLLILNNDLAINSNRAGFLVLSLVPFLLSSTGKNSAVSLLTGISNVKLNFFHRMLGYAIFLLATVHMATMIYSWAKFPSFLASQLAIDKVQYGLGAYACLCVVTLFSFLPFRMLSYEFFMVTHLFGFGFIGAIAIHTPYAMRYFITGLICYLLNLVAVWFVKSYIAQARFEILPEGCTKVSIRLASPIKSHAIGQHIQLCVPAISPFEWHPFTITSVQQSNSTSLEVCVCVRGNFTRKLYNKIKENEDVRVFVSGPFGSRSVQAKQVLGDYSSVVIACGGSGVTFGMRMLRELTETLAMQDCIVKTKHVYFYWCVCRPLELEWFREELERLNYLYYAHESFPQLHILFHNSSDIVVEGNQQQQTTIAVAQVSEDPETINETVSHEEDDTKGLFDDEEKKYPRKSIDTVQGQRIDIPALLSVDNNIGAYVCGPSSFNAAFKRNVALHHLSTVQLHCEDFGY